MRPKDTLNSGKASAGQILVKLDERAANLAIPWAKVRLSNLEAAFYKRNFINREFERKQILF